MEIDAAGPLKFTKFGILNGIKKVRTASYHPKCNGPEIEMA